MKEYKFLTTEENVKCYMGNSRDMCYLGVEKLAESLRSYNHFIIAIEPDFTFHIFTYGGKHLVLKRDEIKEMKTVFSFPFYLMSGYMLSITTIVSFLFIFSVKSLHFSVSSFFLICGALLYYLAIY